MRVLTPRHTPRGVQRLQRQVRQVLHTFMAFWLLVAGWWFVHTKVATDEHGDTARVMLEIRQSNLWLDVPRALRASPAGQLALGLWPEETLRRYYSIFSHQRQGKWEQANTLMAGMTDRRLLGYILAERYLDVRYTPDASELAAWLNSYGEQPQALKIYKRLVTLYPAQAEHISVPSYKRKLWKASAPAYPDHAVSRRSRSDWKKARRYYTKGDYARAYGVAAKMTRRDAEHNLSGHWLAGLSAWQMGQPLQAATHFSAMAGGEGALAEEHRAAAAFWAYRSYWQASGKRKEAANSLIQATAYPDTFYGMLARSLMGLSVSAHVQPMGSVTAQEMTADPEAREILLLAFTGNRSLAEAHMQEAFVTSNRERRHLLRRLAHEIRLTSLNVSAKTGGYLYPVPSWTAWLGRETDTALVLAIVRQESGFDPKAGSRAGAQGLMQIMPKTAKYMEKLGALEVKTASLGEEALMGVLRMKRNLKDIRYNLTIGQSYLNHLKDQPTIGSNLVHVLAAYNAGPGSLKRWQKKMRTRDPLLFIESIPFVETERYVKQVLKNYWVYQQMLDGGTSESLIRLSRNQWPQG